MVCTDCAMPSPCAQYKLTDVILHCWQGAGLLEGNPADPAWELGATSPLHKAGLTTGSPCHVSKALQQNTRWRFPADLGHVRGNNLLPSPGAAPAKESGTSPIAQHPPGTAQLPARKRAVSPGAQPVPTPGCHEVESPRGTNTLGLMLTKDAHPAQMLGVPGPRVCTATAPAESRFTPVQGVHGQEALLCLADTHPGALGSTLHAPVLLGQNPGWKEGCETILTRERDHCCAVTGRECLVAQHTHPTTPVLASKSPGL